MCSIIVIVENKCNFETILTATDYFVSLVLLHKFIVITQILFLYGWWSKFSKKYNRYFTKLNLFIRTGGICCMFCDGIFLLKIPICTTFRSPIFFVYCKITEDLTRYYLWNWELLQQFHIEPVQWLALKMGAFMAWLSYRLFLLEEDFFPSLYQRLFPAVSFPGTGLSLLLLIQPYRSTKSFFALRPLFIFFFVGLSWDHALGGDGCFGSFC